MNWSGPDTRITSQSFQLVDMFPAGFFAVTAFIFAFFGGENPGDRC